MGIQTYRNGVYSFNYKISVVNQEQTQKHKKFTGSDMKELFFLVADNILTWVEPKQMNRQISKTNKLVSQLSLTQQTLDLYLIHSQSSPNGQTIVPNTQSLLWTMGNDLLL